MSKILQNEKKNGYFPIVNRSAYIFCCSPNFRAKNDIYEINIFCKKYDGRVNEFWHPLKSLFFFFPQTF